MIRGVQDRQALRTSIRRALNNYHSRTSDLTEGVVGALRLVRVEFDGGLPESVPILRLGVKPKKTTDILEQRHGDRLEVECPTQEHYLY